MIASADVRLLFSQCSRAGRGARSVVADMADEALGVLGLGVVQLFLRLALELGFADKQAEDRDEALADVLGGNLQSLRRQAVGVDVVADGLADSAFQAALVRSALWRGDSVHVAFEVFRGGLGPLQHHAGARPVFVVGAVEFERRFMDGLRLALRDDLLDVVREPVLVVKLPGFSGGLVGEREDHALVDVARDLDPRGDQGGIERRCGEYLGVGSEVDGGSVALHAAELLEGAGRRSAPECLLPAVAVADGDRGEVHRQRVDNARPDPVKPAGRLVGPGLELAPRVQGREDDFERALAALAVGVDRDSPAVVGDGRGLVVSVQRYADVRCVAVHRLVYGVVENLPDKVVQSAGADAADVHAGTAPYGLQALEYFDVRARILAGFALLGHWSLLSGDK